MNASQDLREEPENWSIGPVECTVLMVVSVCIIACLYMYQVY